MNQLITYVNDQAKYVSHADRKNISLADYINKYSFTSSQAYQIHSNKLL